MNVLNMIYDERRRHIANAGWMPTRVYIPYDWLAQLKKHIMDLNPHTTLGPPKVVVRDDLLIFGHYKQGVRFERR